ncbi:hypothetical protein IWW54_001475 [Coemansia sp. RSA 2705]|nr:hypothetical protein IWW54_001475 [Coemansia sp. RSA 2705]
MPVSESSEELVSLSSSEPPPALIDLPGIVSGIFGGSQTDESTSDAGITGLDSSSDSIDSVLGSSSSDEAEFGSSNSPSALIDLPGIVSNIFGGSSSDDDTTHPSISQSDSMPTTFDHFIDSSSELGSLTSASDELPGISWPEISWPSISLPEISLPIISLPEISLPGISLLPGLDPSDTPTETFDASESSSDGSLLESRTEESSDDGWSPGLPGIITSLLPIFSDSESELSMSASGSLESSDSFERTDDRPDFSDDNSGRSESVSSVSGEFSSSESGDFGSNSESNHPGASDESSDDWESETVTDGPWLSSSKDNLPSESSDDGPGSSHIESSSRIESSTTSSTSKSLLSVPSSVDFSRLTAKPSPTSSASAGAEESSVVYPQVIYNQLASACTQCLKFNIRILAPYENLFGQNNYLASQAFNEIPDVVARALSISYNRVTSTMIFATENAVSTANRRSLLARSEIAEPHYYMSLSIVKDTTVLNPKLELQQLATTMAVQVRDSSSALHSDGVWGSLIDTSYMKVTSDLNDLNGVAQVAPNSPGQVDSPFKGDSKSTSRSKWIGIGIGIFFAVLIVILVIYWRVRHKKNKEKFRSNFVAIE